MIINILPTDWDEARVLAKQVKEKMTKNSRKITPWNDGKNLEYSYLIGFLGELVFARHFGLPKPVLIDDIKDEYDFKIGKLRIDLKTKAETKKLLIDTSRWEIRKNIDVYIFAEIYENYFRIIGWCTHAEVPRISKIELAPGRQNYSIIPRKLKPIQELRELT